MKWILLSIPQPLSVFLQTVSQSLTDRSEFETTWPGTLRSSLRGSSQSPAAVVKSSAKEETSFKNDKIWIYTFNIILIIDYIENYAWE